MWQLKDEKPKYTMHNKGITIIGMTGAGKTTIGPILARKLGWPLYDVDKIIAQNDEYEKQISEFVSKNGTQYLIDLEAECVSRLNLNKCILITPGSIIYGTACHPKIKNETTVIYLDVPFPILEERFYRTPEKAKGIVGIEDGLEAVFKQRQPLYEGLADSIVKCGRKQPEAIAEEIIKLYNSHLSHARQS